MKKLLAVMLCLLFMAGCAVTETPVQPAATPSESESPAPASTKEPVANKESLEDREPARVIPVPLSSPKLTFDTTDVNGNQIDSSIFEGYEITMINIWATWCGPCVAEMPEIAKAVDMLPENANIITICTDYYESEQTMADAVTILEDSDAAGITTLTLDANLSEFMTENITAFPTTIYVNAAGQMVGDYQIGMPGGIVDSIAKAYISVIEGKLEE